MELSVEQKAAFDAVMEFQKTDRQEFVLAGYAGAGKTTLAIYGNHARQKESYVGRAMNVHFSSKTDMWATPQILFDELNKKFSFEVDVCAIAENAKCEKYFTPEMDGLKQEWHGICWMNPPYGRGIGEWIKKAYESSMAGALVVCLLPARTDTRWFHDYCTKGKIQFIRGRLKFGGHQNAAPFPSMIVVFGNKP